MAGTAPISGAADSGAADPLIAAHRAMRADHNLQFQFQDYVAPKPPAWLDPLSRFLRLVGPYLQIIFWIGVALLLAGVLFLVAREAVQRFGLLDFRKKAKPPAPSMAAFRPTATRARALLEEADLLAGEGRYSEAVRVLLHRSIEDIERAYPVSIGPAATAREIARLEPLSQQGRDVFGQIAQAVETSLFGQRPLNAQRFAECRAAYSSFALGRNG